MPGRKLEKGSPLAKLWRMNRWESSKDLPGMLLFLMVGATTALRSAASNVARQAASEQGTASRARHSGLPEGQGFPPSDLTDLISDPYFVRHANKAGFDGPLLRWLAASGSCPQPRGRP